MTPLPPETQKARFISLSHSMKGGFGRTPSYCMYKEQFFVVEWSAQFPTNLIGELGSWPRQSAWNLYKLCPRREEINVRSGGETQGCPAEKWRVLCD